jgi:hypothetical protein
MAQSQQPPLASPPPKLTHVDRPEISETFVDSLAKVMFDGMNVRMEFVVNRLDDPKPPAAPTGRATTACRLVIPAPGMLDLINKLQMLIATLQAQGALRQIVNPATSGKPN